MWTQETVIRCKSLLGSNGQVPTLGGDAIQLCPVDYQVTTATVYVSTEDPTAPQFTSLEIAVFFYGIIVIVHLMHKMLSFVFRIFDN